MDMTWDDLRVICLLRGTLEDVVPFKLPSMYSRVYKDLLNTPFL